MSQEGLADAPHPRSHPESGPLLPVIAPVAGFLYPFCKEGGLFMTIHIQMLQEIATSAQAMAGAAQAMAASMQAMWMTAPGSSPGAKRRGRARRP